MKLTWRDMISTVLVIIGAVVVIAKLNSYTWWLIGSWKGALGVLGVLGLAILLTGIIELVRVFNASVLTQTLLWLISATVVIGSLLSATTKMELLTSTILIGLAWLTQIIDHLLIAATHNHRHHRSHPMAV